MKPTWIIEEPKFLDEHSSQRMFYAIQELGMDVIMEKYRPFTGNEYGSFPTDRPVIHYGSINFIKDFQRKKPPNIFPFCWCNFEELRCRNYYNYFGKYLIQQKYGFYPFLELNRLKNWLYEVYGKNGKIFIRPDSNDKAFDGEVITNERFDCWFELTNSPPLTSLTVVSEYVKIEKEWRFFIVNNKVITGSQYKDSNCLECDANYPEEAAKFAEEASVSWEASPIYCMDIALTEDGYKVIEIGSMNCAGIYKSDARKIVEAVSEVAIKEYQEIFGG